MPGENGVTIYVWRGSLLDTGTRKRVTVYFAGFLAKGWTNLTTNGDEATQFLSAPQAQSLLTQTKRVIPWMQRFTVAKHPVLSENRD